MKIDIDVGSLRASLHNMGKVKDEVFIKASKAALKAAGMELRAALLKNASLTDHSLDALAAMDYPYAARHGSIQVHGDKPYQVHKQSGAMSSKITGRLIRRKGRAWTYRVGFNYNAVEHAKYVVEGTKVLLPRNVVVKTAQEQPVRQAMMRAIVKTLGKGFRTGAGVRFG